MCQRICGLLLPMLAVFALLTSNLTAVNWQTNYDQAMDQAKRENKEVVLLFTGSDWCVWCKKLEGEALNTADFDKLAGDKFIFVKLDFPMKSAQDGQITAQNKRLKDHFGVRGFPSVIILDPNGKQIGVTGYRPGGGKAYAEHLLKLSHDFSGYQN